MPSSIRLGDSPLTASMLLTSLRGLPRPNPLCYSRCPERPLALSSTRPKSRPCSARQSPPFWPSPLRPQLHAAPHFPSPIRPTFRSNWLQRWICLSLLAKFHWIVTYSHFDSPAETFAVRQPLPSAGSLSPLGSPPTFLQISPRLPLAAAADGRAQMSLLASSYNPLIAPLLPGLSWCPRGLQASC